MSWYVFSFSNPVTNSTRLYTKILCGLIDVYPFIGVDFCHFNTSELNLTVNYLIL